MIAPIAPVECFVWNKDKQSIIDLQVYNFRQSISSIKVKKDEWEPAGIALENETIDTSESGEKIAKTITLSVNDKDVGVTVIDSISRTIVETKGWNWDIRAGVTAKTEVTGKIGAVEVMGGLEVSVEGGYGQSGETTTEVNLSGSVEMTPTEPGTYKASLIYKEGRMKAMAVRKLRNPNTGDIIEQRGEFYCNKAGQTRVEVHRVRN